MTRKPYEREIGRGSFNPQCDLAAILPSNTGPWLNLSELRLFLKSDLDARIVR
jgi:hypothetical protein